MAKKLRKALLRTMTEVDKILKELDSLKPVPEIASKLMSIADDPQSSMGDVVEVIQYDQAVTGHLLRVCNSAYFGLPRKIDSVHQAAAYLGMDQIIDLVLLRVCGANLKEDQDGYELDKGELWRHSVLSAVLAKEIAANHGAVDEHLVFTAGLLKDIGKVILSRPVGAYFSEIHHLVQEEGLSFMEAERAVIGIDHAQLGAIAAERWNLSQKMVKTIRNHHLERKGSEGDLETAAVYIADLLCMMMGLGIGSDGLAYRFRQRPVEALGLSEKDLEDIMASFGHRLQEVEDLLDSA